VSRLAEISPTEISDNPIESIGKQWMLIVAGTPERHNCMTASWGALGELWFKSVAFCFVRPGRHTFGFMEANDAFTLCFFEEAYREKLNFCGTRSGRDVDKAGECGFTPVPSGHGGVYFDEARLVLECRKIYSQDLDPSRFLDEAIAECYPDGDYHRLFVGEIVRALVRG